MLTDRFTCPANAMGTGRTGPFISILEAIEATNGAIHPCIPKPTARFEKVSRAGRPRVRSSLANFPVANFPVANLLRLGFEEESTTGRFRDRERT